MQGNPGLYFSRADYPNSWIHSNTDEQRDQKKFAPPNSASQLPCRIPWRPVPEKNAPQLGKNPPLIMVMMRDEPYKARSFITMRNQRGYGTQKNWMAVRQELLYYTKGNPIFNVDAEYTDIPKILRGYYKEVNGRKTENLERSKSDNIRAGNVWVLHSTT